MRHLFAFEIAAAAAHFFPIAPGQQLGFKYPYETMTVAEICHENCYNSLMELRLKIEAACNTNMDAVAFLYEDKIFPHASEFEEMTSSCNATGYDYTKPAPYATTLSTESWATMVKSALAIPTP
uniref:Uncharacterized protein n=1 Tax=Fusarium oxysporum (strain Fo5176) TaxID=660025 RepID=A0A0D2XCC9_FUSOF